ncbi:hypothetical protein E2C01_098350 [Portunus trituberculatus]|uniref:Uncharacterized protein n=1 Tax=Portunus trituberculatus TaxID=210409 RepID=A0A5B7KBW0_PORTR|nr:hypothetical protein [Portunus trituberculatus]
MCGGHSGSIRMWWRRTQCTCCRARPRRCWRWCWLSSSPSNLNSQTKTEYCINI